MSKQSLVRRRLRLFREDPLCPLCGKEMVLRPNRHDTATIEHLVSRNHPLRGKMKGETMLMCRRCNGERGADEERTMPIEELWRRSGRMPLPPKDASREQELQKHLYAEGRTDD